MSQEGGVVTTGPNAVGSIVDMFASANAEAEASAGRRGTERKQAQQTAQECDGQERTRLAQLQRTREEVISLSNAAIAARCVSR